MKLLYIGSGFVGACSAAVSAASGHEVLVYDVDEQKIKKLSSGDKDIIESSLFEDGLGELIVRNQDRIKFTTNYQEVVQALDECHCVFMCLPTPEIGETGESDLSFYRSAAQQLAAALVERNNGRQEQYVVIVNKSTVPIEMADQTKDIMDVAGVKNYGVVSNPEFLVEGQAIQGSLKPDRVVIGAWAERDFQVMREAYQRFYDSPTTKYIEVNPKEAAASKLLANYYLFNRLAVCFDVIGRTCEAFSDLKFENIRKVLTSDERIGTWGFYNSLYAGGSCFIKDARSLAHQLQTIGQNSTLVSDTYLANRRQLELFLARAEQEAECKWSGKTVALLGAAFKRNTNDTRNSPSVDIINFLAEKEAKQVRIFDPIALGMLKKDFSESDVVKYVSDAENAILGADVVIIATDWPQFRGLGDTLLQDSARPLIMDGRRMLQHRYFDLQQSGFDIIAVGSPFMKGGK